MHTPVIIISIIFITIGFIITENNAKYLLAGYNTMSEDERKIYNQKKLIGFIKRFFWFLGGSTLVIGLGLVYFANEKSVHLFVSFYPVACIVYMLVESNRGKYKKAP